MSTSVVNLYKLKELIVVSHPIIIIYLSQRNSSSGSKKNEQIYEKESKNKKVIIKKIFPANPKKPLIILESTDASKLIKRYHWENKYLFGPVQSTNNNNFSDESIYESNEIIQHHTQFPILEPQNASKSNFNVGTISKDVPIGNKKVKFDYNKVLEFPLLNKAIDESDIQRKINELNVLRKYLESKSGLKMPSVSAILEKTMPKENAAALERWKQNMIEKLGEEGFQKYRNEMLKAGSSLHVNINSYLAATPESDILIAENNLGHWKSLKAIFPNVANVKLLEEKVSHPFLCYRGVVDCFAKYKGHLVVIDWKTSKKPKPSISSTFDNPLQIAAYVGALNFDPKFQYLANKGLIVVAYENGKPGTVHLIEEERMLHYWKEWLKRVKLFWEMKESSED